MKKQIKNKNELLKNYKKIFDFFENSNIEKSSGFGRPRSKKRPRLRNTCLKEYMYL